MSVFVAYVVIAVLLSLALVLSASQKLRHDPSAVRIIHEVVHVPMSWFPFLAGCEVAGAIGLLVGIAWAPIGIAASIGVILYMVGALIAHLRVGDAKGIVSPLVPLALGIVALVTGLAR
jgi:thiamine transporter ThiT